MEMAQQNLSKSACWSIPHSKTFRLEIMTLRVMYPSQVILKLGDKKAERGAGKAEHLIFPLVIIYKGSVTSN